MFILQELHQKKMKWIFSIDSFKTGSEIENLTSLGTFFQSWVALYVMLSKPNISVLGFWQISGNFSGCTYFVLVWKRRSWYQEIAHFCICKPESYGNLSFFGRLTFHLHPAKVFSRYRLVGWDEGIAHVCCLFYQYFVKNIHINGQQQKLRFNKRRKTRLKNIWVFCSVVMYFWNLVKALHLLPSFLVIFTK